MIDFQEDDLWDSESSSPFNIALVHNMPVIRDMLYESGSCSYRELFRPYTDFSNGRSFCYDVTTDLSYLQKEATTPRSFQSTCRLVIDLALLQRPWKTSQGGGATIPSWEVYEEPLCSLTLQTQTLAKTCCRAVYNMR